MSWDEAIGSVKEKLPRFNDYLLKGYREEQEDVTEEMGYMKIINAITL